MSLIQEWVSNNREISLQVTVKTNSKKRFFLVVKDKDKPNSQYAKREMEVNGERTIYFSFPVTTRVMVITITDMANPKDNNFSATFEEIPLKKYQIWIDEETRDFLKLAEHFCKVAGYQQALPTGRIFKSSDDKFIIKYYPVIVDFMSGKQLSTPARIGHTTGNIDIAKCKFDRYTFAERVIIILHEFSHKYRNPKLGLAISNEIGADTNALYIYLGLGFSKIDAINVFANVFLKARSESNMKRMRSIMDYIQKFENGEYADVA